METPTYQPQNTGGVRSTFLTIICVLTFIGSGWGVINGVRQFITADSTAAKAAASMEKLQDKMDSQDTPSFAKNIFNAASATLNPATLRESAIFSFVSCVLTLVGAILMWNLNKAGFYLYITGIFVLLVSPFVIMGVGFLAVTSAVSTLIIGGAFIAMYSANLKDMRA